VEPEGTAGEQSDAGVDRLDEGVGKPVLKGDEDGVDVVGDGVTEADEGVNAGTPCPLHPLFKEQDGVVEGQLKDESEVLLEQVGTEQWLVDALDPGQLADLLVGQVLGVLPERIARALQPSVWARAKSGSSDTSVGHVARPCRTGR